MAWKHYKRNPDGTVEETTDLAEANQNRRVARDVIRRENLEILISTVFLGLDHSHVNTGPPILWETMIFGFNDNDDIQWRYSSEDSAREGHRTAIELANMMLDQIRDERLRKEERARAKEKRNCVRLPGL